MLLSFSRQALPGAGADARGVEALQLERERLQAVARFGGSEAAARRGLTRAAEVAARIAGTPIGACTLVDGEAVRVVAAYGFEAPADWPRDAGLCATTIAIDRPRVIERADLDRRTALHPLVVGELGLRFYLGIPLRTGDGYNVGTLCAIDRTARSVDVAAIAALEALADLTVNVFEHISGTAMVTDPVTGLPGRRLFEERVERHAREETWERSWGAVAVLGIDGLESIDERAGKGARARAIRAIGDALRATLEAEGDPFHIDSDEFAVVAGVAATYEPTRLQLAIDNALRTVHLAGFSEARAKMGVATFDEVPSLRDAYRLAGWRMYAEKAGRR